MKQLRFDHRFETRIVSIILSIFMILSILSGYIEKFIDIPSRWEIPIILLALLMITRMLPTIYNIDENMRKLRQEIGYMEVKRYDTYGEFYKDLEISLSMAKVSLDLTHIRDDPPDHFVLGESYFDRIEKWLIEHPGFPCRRIIAVNNEPMSRWADELSEMTKKHRNFHVRACDWSSKFPMINMAIIDGEKVFLAITADIAERTAGLRIEDPAMAKYFGDYYDNVWAHSNELSDALSKLKNQ